MAAATAAAVEAAPEVAPRPLAVAKAGRAEGGMKAPAPRPAKKARQDAYDPMDPVRTLITRLQAAACCIGQQNPCILYTNKDELSVQND